MKSYQYQSLIPVIMFSLLSLLSNPAVTRVRAEEERATALAGQGNERLSPPEANWRRNSVVHLLPDPAALALAGLTFTVNSTADPGTGICDSTECTLREAITAANAAAGLRYYCLQYP